MDFQLELKLKESCHSPETLLFIQPIGMTVLGACVFLHSHLCYRCLLALLQFLEHANVFPTCLICINLLAFVHHFLTLSLPDCIR